MSEPRDLADDQWQARVWTRAQRLVLIAVAAVLGLLFVWSVDTAVRTLEARALIDGIEESEAEMEAWLAVVTAQERELDEGPQVDGRPAAYMVEAAAAEIESEARDRAATVYAANEQLARLNVAPWHRDVQEAKATYLEHGEAWEDYLTAIGGGARDKINSSDPGISRTWVVLKADLPAVVPFPDVLGLHSCVDEVLAN